MTTERRAYHPKRHLRNEVYSLVLVLAAPVGILAVFPYAALSFNVETGNPPPRSSFCSFVSLTDEQVDAAVQAARSAIRTSHEGISALRTDLSISSIPVESGSVADVSERNGVAPMAFASYDVLPLPASNAAPAPQRISQTDSANELPPAFSREELLEIIE